MRYLALAMAFLLAPAWAAETSVEVGKGVFYNPDANLVLVGITTPDRPLFGINSYRQYNVGAWDGPRYAVIAGVAKGLQWDIGTTTVRLSTGTSLISHTSDRLSTTFQFYEQLMVRHRFSRHHSFAVSYRHWSNAFIKLPNLGMDFVGVQMEYGW